MYDNRKSYVLATDTHSLPDDLVLEARGDLVFLKENGEIQVNKKIEFVPK